MWRLLRWVNLSRSIGRGSRGQFLSLGWEEGEVRMDKMRKGNEDEGAS